MSVDHFRNFICPLREESLVGGRESELRPANNICGTVTDEGHDEVACVAEEHPAVVAIFRPFRSCENLINESVDANDPADPQARHGGRKEPAVKGTLLLPKPTNLFLSGDDAFDTVVSPISLAGEVPALRRW